jgi:hypothetical protein
MVFVSYPALERPNGKVAQADADRQGITQSPLAAVTESSLNAEPRCIKVVDTFRRECASLPVEYSMENFEAVCWNSLWTTNIKP